MSVKFEIEEVPSQAAVIKVFGVGGCGGNAVDHMIANGMQGVEFICANTDVQALKRTKAGIQVQLGQKLTRGLGAGAKPEVGRDAAIEDRNQIEDLIRGTDLLFITAGMGGGTGTGAAPVVAEIAKEMGILTVAVVTRPFAFEGKRQKTAQAGIDALAEHVNSLIVVPNDKLIEVLGNAVTVDNAFRASNDVLHGAVAGIAEIISAPGMINVDFADVKTVLSETGMAMMGSACAAGTDRARAAAEQAIACPLLEDMDIADARGILVNISASRATFQLQEFYDVMGAIKALSAETSDPIIGTVYDESLGDALRVTIVATGVGQKAVMRAPQPKMQVVQGTGTDGPMSVDYGELEVPTTFRSNRNRQSVEAMEKAGMDKYDIPAFLRKQAD